MKMILIALIAVLVSFIPSSKADVVKSEYIVKLKSSTGVRDVNPIFSFFEFRGDRKLIDSLGNGLLHVRLGDQDLEDLKEGYSEDFEYIEKNTILKIKPVSSDFITPIKQWGLNNTKGTHVDAMKAWSITRGSKDVVVGVIDTGVDYNHEALLGNMWTNTQEIAGDGIDNDGNGYIDDVRGWNFASNSADPFDDNMHGTHCAGIIAGNSLTAMGIAPNVKIMPLKFLTAEGSGSLDGAIKAINYGVKMGATILSNSWGGGGYSQALYDVIRDAEKAGVLFIAASGNEYNDNDKEASYPNSYKLENIISVGASTIAGGKAYFSNYGATTVHIFAPGKDIWSSVPNGYKSLSGTSMACPMVSGIAALVKSVHPEYTYADIKKAIMNSAVEMPGLKGYSITNGLVNAYNAVK